MKTGGNIIVAADNDLSTEESKGTNPGTKAGEKAARAINAELCICPVESDFNDLCNSYKDKQKGLEAVREALKQTTIPEKAVDWEEPRPLPINGDTGNDQQYNLDLLPEPIMAAASEVARFAKVPVESPGIIGLSCCATAIRKKAVVVERPGLKHHPSMFHVLIAASGERKSPAFSNMTLPLEQWTNEQKESYEDLRREAMANNMTIDAAIKGLQNQAKKQDAILEPINKKIENLDSQRIQEPPDPSLFTTDTTEERLFQKMHDREGAYAVMSGEGRQVFDAIMGKYSGDSRTGDAIYLAGISGDTITRDRVGGDKGPEERHIFKPCLNVCVMVQPDKYLEAARLSSLKESGALARIWPVWLSSLVGKRIEQENEPGLDTAKMGAYNNLIRDLLQAEPPTYEDQACHEAHLSIEASNARRDFHNEIERMMADGEELEDVRAIASKAVSQTAKLALVLHLADNPSLLNQAESEISFEAWTRAQCLGTYHLQEAIRVQRMADENKDIEKARKILKWIVKNKYQEITVTMVIQTGPRPRPNAKEAEPILDTLVDYGYLRKENNKRKPVYLVNPLWFFSQFSQFSQGGGKK